MNRLIFCSLRRFFSLRAQAPLNILCFFLLLMDGLELCGRPTPPLSFPAILSAELNREFNALKAKADPPPYYMAYEATEEQSDSASATLGALVEENHAHNRGVDTTIRVGSAAFDNYHPLKGSRGRFTTFTTLSIDNDPNEISRQLWTETDHVYRLASRRLLQLKTDEQLLADQATKDADFSVEPAAKYSQLPETYSYDKKAWAQRVRTWSAEFKNHPLVMGSEVSFSVGAA